MAPLWSTTEQDLVNIAGMDATIFMRFTRMCRNMFVIMSILGCCILVPVNYTTGVVFPDSTWLARITPSNVWGVTHWATVAVAWLFILVICGFLWWNYRKVVQLRRQYFESEEYQQSLHARTLMVGTLLSLEVARTSADLMTVVRYTQELRLGRGHSQDH